MRTLVMAAAAAALLVAGLSPLAAQPQLPGS
jgi:hypothetical protein